MTPLERQSTVTFRPAVRGDLPTIVALLAADQLGAQRERVDSPLAPSYYAAFDIIDADPNNELVVACLGDEVVGVLQLTFIPYLTYQGSWRAQVEGVRVAAAHRSKRLGRHLLEWAIARSRQRGCRMVQLTTNKSRADALRFYESLGFAASHEGLKLMLEPEA